MAILRKLEKNKDFWFVIFTFCMFFLLRLPSLFEPLWYGEEGIYQTIGSSLNNGKLLYKEIFDNKPPLLYWTYSILHSDQFLTRLASLIVGVFTVAAFFFLSKKLFKHNKNNIHFITTSVFTVLFGLPILEGNIANAENFMLLPIIVAALLISRLQLPSRQHRDGGQANLKYFLAGTLLGIAFLFKIVAIFDLAAFLIFYFIVNFDSLKRYTKLPFIVIGFLLPILAVSLFFLSNNTFADFIKAVFITNIAYVSYGNEVHGLPWLLFIKLTILAMFCLYIVRNRKKISSVSIFILIWFAFSLFNAFFSQRLYTHSLLVVLPSLSLTLGLILFDNKYRKIIAIIFLAVLITIINNFKISNFEKNISYYQNFISYIQGKKSTALYQAFFDPNTPVDYEISRFIKPKISKNDTIFVWGNNAQLYQLTGTFPSTKYIAAYHILNYSDRILDTQLTIEKTKPKFIVVMPDQKSIPFPLINYSEKININKAIIYETVF